MNIPTGFNGEVHFYLDPKYGWVEATPKAWGKKPGAGCIYLGSVSVSVQFADVRQAAADAIDAQIESVRAELANRIAILQGQKASLMAIECDK